MIPDGVLPSDVVFFEQVESSKTYALDFDTGRIRGMVDGLDALRQAAFKIMQTERFQFVIYSATYGSEFETLIGKDRAFVEAEIARRIEEALLEDERFLAVEDVSLTFQADEVLVTFVVYSIEGEFSLEVKQIV